MTMLVSERNVFKFKTLLSKFCNFFGLIMVVSLPLIRFTNNSPPQFDDAVVYGKNVNLRYDNGQP